MDYVLYDEKPPNKLSLMKVYELYSYMNRVKINPVNIIPTGKRGIVKSDLLKCIIRSGKTNYLHSIILSALLG